MLQLDKEMQKLPSISRREHKIFHGEIQTHLDGTACQFLHQNDDLIATGTDRAHQYFGALVYGEGPITSFIKKLIRREPSPTQGHATTVEIDSRVPLILIKVIVAFISGVLLLFPVAILFLVELSRVVSFVVVVVFIFAFVTVMSKLDANWDTILVGLSAYMAVLVTFLSNLA
ncbi:hypothetical protein M426DRAFT_17230 [Hypoxylon sp. CI-4A]|nr:hypothetical protein M426DRAFT_17230 [Hypoxylon sp. CI-4A]